MRLPEHIKTARLRMGANGLLQLPAELAAALDLQPGCEVLLCADTQKGMLNLQRMYGFVPQVLAADDGISAEARQTAAEILAAFDAGEDKR